MAQEGHPAAASKRLVEATRQVNEKEKIIEQQRKHIAQLHSHLVSLQNTSAEQRATIARLQEESIELSTKTEILEDTVYEQDMMLSRVVDFRVRDDRRDAVVLLQENIALQEKVTRLSRRVAALAFQLEETLEGSEITAALDSR